MNIEENSLFYASYEIEDALFPWLSFPADDITLKNSISWMLPTCKDEKHFSLVLSSWKEPLLYS